LSPIEHHPPKGPVLLNCGIEEARKQVERQRNPALTGPVYPGASLRCHPERCRRVTVKEKVDQEKKPKTEDSPKGAHRNGYCEVPG